MLNISVLNVTTPTGRSLPAQARLGGVRPSPKKHRNLDCHPGASAGILTPPLPRRRSWPRAVREAVKTCTRILMLRIAKWDVIARLQFATFPKSTDRRQRAVDCMQQMQHRRHGIIAQND
jgi:hypothetical protein